MVLERITLALRCEAADWLVVYSEHGGTLLLPLPLQLAASCIVTGAGPPPGHGNFAHDDPCPLQQFSLPPRSTGEGGTNKA